MTNAERWNRETLIFSFEKKKKIPRRVPLIILILQRKTNLLEAKKI